MKRNISLMIIVLLSIMLLLSVCMIRILFSIPCSIPVLPMAHPVFRLMKKLISTLNLLNMLRNNKMIFGSDLLR